jgi:hypothetical protein
LININLLVYIEVYVQIKIHNILIGYEIIYYNNQGEIHREDQPAYQYFYRYGVLAEEKLYQKLKFN